jgi:hypothetical protein
MNEFTAIAIVLTLFVLRFATPILAILGTGYLANYWLNRMEKHQEPPTPTIQSGG